MISNDLLDLIDHAMEPEPWECDEQWEYRAMHWRSSAQSGDEQTE